MANYFGCLLWVTLTLFLSISGKIIQEQCCSKATSTCRVECEKISLLDIAFDPEKKQKTRENLSSVCREAPESFLSCIQDTFQAIQSGEGWYGRPCCKLLKTLKCLLKCLAAQNKEEVLSECSAHNEMGFSVCIERQETSEMCCRNASTSSCEESCRELFANSLVENHHVVMAVQDNCKENQAVLKCIKLFSQFPVALIPVRDIRCCDWSLDVNCRMFCSNIIQSGIDDGKIIDEMKPKCRASLYSGLMWDCFFKEPDTDIKNNILNSKTVQMIDAAKLQCCSVAFSATCRKLCFEQFQDESETQLFKKRCSEDSKESDLIQCLIEIDEPCELGCQVLEFCRNFNDRSTEFFRTCNKQAEKVAEKNLNNWKAEKRFLGNKGEIIPLLDITVCHPEAWKAFTCVQQLKPCQKLREHANKICRSECESILAKCVEVSRLKKGESSSRLCDLISPSSDDEPCISLKPYLYKSEHPNTAVEVTLPCVPNPCNATEVCMVDRNCQIGQRCFPSVCIPGCVMGKKSRLVVPRETYIRIPKVEIGRPEKCYQVSYCNINAELEDNNRPHCINNDDCWHNGRKISHNTQTKRGCAVCVCYAGEMTCTQMQCSTIGNRIQRVLPCNCPDHYVPVCGANGKTYPSACLARCESLNDEQFEFGACYESDPCSPNSCQPQHRCIPRKRVCLSITHKSCKQYDCVDMQQNCNQQPRSPVCDKDNIEHSNLCWMLQKGKSLGHYGKCMHHCRSYGRVCGHNGETYDSECAAWAERVSVDYRGSCVAVGTFDGSTTTRCSSVKCPPMPSEHCPQVYLPGGCCPVCGAALRLMFSQKLADWAVDAVRNVEPVVIQRIAEKLREHVKVLECDVFAFLSVQSIIAVVVTTADYPTKIQIKACLKEAEKLELLIQKTSPRVVTELPLSFITAASVIEPANTANLAIHSKFLFITLLLPMIFMKLFR